MLRKLAQDAGPRELAQLGAPVDPDLLYRSLAYAIDPEWTRGHNFRVGYEVAGEGGGRWHLDVGDGVIPAARLRRPRARRHRPRCHVDTFRKLLSGELTPAGAMQQN